MNVNLIEVTTEKAAEKELIAIINQTADCD